MKTSTCQHYDTPELRPVRIYEMDVRYRLVSEGLSGPLDTAQRACDYFREAFDDDPTVECFYAVFLNRKNYPLGRKRITTGTANSSLVHPREVLKPALLVSASGIIVAHNHPSGDPAPSQADISVTRQLREACKVMGIELIDHVIIGHPEYYSFSESGFL